MIAFQAIETRYGVERVCEIFAVTKNGMLRRSGTDMVPTRVPVHQMDQVLNSLKAEGKRLMFLDERVATAFMLP